MNQPIYAIGDIHGQHDMLLDALTRIEADGGAQARVVILGDLVDRGPGSRAVLRTLISGLAQGRDWIVLMGNHDRLFLDFLQTSATENRLIRSGKSWLHEALGGGETLASYGIDPNLPVSEVLAIARAVVPQSHIDFLRSRPLYHIEGNLLFVHAGIHPDLPLEWQDEEQFIWIREPFLSHEQPFPWLVVHGHTAQELPRHFGNRINLDGGAGWGRPLTTAVIEGSKAWVLTPKGRVPLEP